MRIYPEPALCCCTAAGDGKPGNDNGDNVKADATAKAAVDATKAQIANLSGLAGGNRIQSGSVAGALRT